jgi:uncharacterized protein
MTFYIYKDANYQWRWYVAASNGRKIANSGEGYHNKQDCLNAIGLVMDTNRSTPVYEQ